MTQNDPWFDSIAAKAGLSKSELHSLHEMGFIVTEGPIPRADMPTLSQAYDSAVALAEPTEVKEGSTTTRVTDFVNRGPEFDGLCWHAPLLHACCSIIQQPFRLSTVVARTLRPGKVPTKLHVDFPSDACGWPMVGFIFMVDEFRSENGATRFLPGSQGMPETSGMLERSVPACGPAGSMILYNGSVWHEHGPNVTDAPRRSIQGALIRRTERAALDWRSRMRPESLSRLNPLSKYLLDL
jgi:ectoine hydroxylase-related dioxygenase (phytanoyl-CoA dioxygenase family)